MAGYSTTPLARKLGVKPASEVLLRHAPRGWSIPDTAVSSVDIGQADIVVAFYRSRVALR